MEPAVRPLTTLRSMRAKSAMTGMVAMTEPANRCCRSTWYWPMKELRATGRGWLAGVVVRVARRLLPGS
jgi:hypothetical protein